MTLIANRFPLRAATRRIAILDDMPPRVTPGMPGYDADRELLAQLLAHAGIDYDTCFHGWLASGDALAADLATYAPHFIIAIDRQQDKKQNVLRALFGDWRPVDAWRGSVERATLLAPGVKCMATYHPSRLRLEYALTGVVRFDMARAAKEAQTDELVVPVDVIDVDCSVAQYVAMLRVLQLERLRVAIDIEGYVDRISCIGFATGHNTAFVVPFMHDDGTSWWTEDEEVQLWEAIAAVLEDASVPKVLQNCLYDAFVLAWSYGIVIEGICDDTMLKHFELYCELEKSLGFQTSIYTSHPAYKHQRKSADERVQLTYCGRDCCRTLECCDAQEKLLKPKQREHYRFNMSLLAPLLYMSLRGIRYDAEAAAARLAETQTTIYELQDEINREAASGRPRLHEYFAAVDAGCGLHSGAEAKRRGDHCAAALIPFLADAFCCAESMRREKRDVEEVSWQPMRHNGKRWVKAGKRIPWEQFPRPEEGQAPYNGGNYVMQEAEPETVAEGIVWLKRHVKVVERSFPVAVETVADVRRFTKDSCRAECRRSIQLITEGALAGDAGTASARGELATLLGIHVKVNATSADGDAQWYLYTHCGLPKQFQKEGNRLTNKLASDDEAILKAWVHSGKSKETRDPRALAFLKMRRTITQTRYLTAKPDADGRIRSAINLVATPTCRMAMYGSPTGTSDLNLQTIGKKLRSLFRADEGCYLGQKDLDNSDAYSVAAFCANIGDRTMLEDVRARLKPAKILALIYAEGSAVNQLSRDQLKVECAKVDGEGWLYFACKRVLHGSNYGMGKLTMANQILTDSYKLLGDPVYLEASACERIQKQSFFVRYPGVQRWHAWMKQQIATEGQLVTSTGFTRRIFGRKDSHDTLKECLAHYPQYYTTNGIKLALLRQWVDAENRRADGSLIVEPLLVVHDSKLSQWRIEDTAFAKRKEDEWWQNEQRIASELITIPATGAYGVSWADMPHSL